MSRGLLRVTLVVVLLPSASVAGSLHHHCKVRFNSRGNPSPTGHWAKLSENGTSCAEARQVMALWIRGAHRHPRAFYSKSQVVGRWSCLALVERIKSRTRSRIVAVAVGCAASGTENLGFRGDFGPTFRHVELG